MNANAAVVKAFLLQLHAGIVAELEALDGGGAFRLDSWDRPAGGGGKTALIEGGSGSSIMDTEPNNSRTMPQDITSATFPVTITGTIGTSTDVDYYKLTLDAGQTLSANLTVPSSEDYDLDLYSSSGSILTRSINAGNGVPEAITYTNSGAQTITCYPTVRGYGGAFSATQTYTLIIRKQ